MIEAKRGIFDLFFNFFLNSGKYPTTVKTSITGLVFEGQGQTKLLNLQKYSYTVKKRTDHTVNFILNTYSDTIKKDVSSY